jgi:hypothetical protein
MKDPDLDGFLPLSRLSIPVNLDEKYSVQVKERSGVETSITMLYNACVPNPIVRVSVRGPASVDSADGPNCQTTT